MSNLTIYDHEKIARQLDDIYEKYKDVDINTLDDGTKKLLLDALKKREYYHRYYRIFYFSPLKWNKEYFKKSLTNRMMAVIAGNRLGKSYTATWIAACHMLGWYPSDWYEGVKFDASCKPNGAECLSFILLGVTIEQMNRPRAILDLLFGSADARGTGWLPKDFIMRIENKIGHSRVPGKVYVKYIDNTNTTIDINTYQAGQNVIMGSIYSAVFLDESCNDKTIFPQAIKRTNNAYRMINGERKTGGIVHMVLTPEVGRSDTIDLFWDADSQYHDGLVNVTLYDCDDLYTQEEMDEFVNSIPPWQRSFSIMGIPSAGAGQVFAGILIDSLLDSSYTPKKTDKRLISVDFGYQIDPNVILTVYKDSGTGIFYVHHEKVDKDREAFNIALELKDMQKTVRAPLIWPRDGSQSRGYSESIIEVYQNNGVKTTYLPFANLDLVHDQGNINIEIGIVYLRELMIKGLLRIHPRCANLIKELSLYSYNDKGAFIDKNNHSLDALRYALCAFSVYAVTDIAEDGPNLTSAQIREHMDYEFDS